MDFKRLVAFFAISLAIFAGWEHFFPSPKPNPAQQAPPKTTAATPANPPTPSSTTSQTTSY